MRPDVVDSQQRRKDFADIFVRCLDPAWSRFEQFGHDESEDQFFAPLDCERC